MVLAGQAVFSQLVEASEPVTVSDGVLASYAGGAGEGAESSPRLAGFQQSFEPVAPEPEQADASALVKATRLAEVAAQAATARAAEAARTAEAARAAEAAARVERRKAAPEPAAPPPAPVAPKCEPDRSGFGAVKSWVAEAGVDIRCRFDIDTVGGVADRANASDHPKGLALDFMVRGERGDELAEYVLRNQDELNVKYVIWEQRINSGSGWDRMEDRGGDTANHMDHVHVSFESG